MSEPPSGTITFLFTDIEGSTRRWDEQPEAMRDALARHDAIIRQSIERHGGYVFKTVGDGFYAAFSTALPALAAAVDAQRALAAEPWGDARPGPVRMALHTGAVDERAGDYFGAPLNHLARLKEAAHGGQVLLSGVTAELVRDRLPDGVQLRDLGEHRLRDVARPWRIYQLAIWGLPADFPPLRTADARPHNLPTPRDRFVGREREVSDVAQLLRRPGVRLVTLTGPGGVGKTRLALEAGAAVLGDFADGVFFVELAALADAALLPGAVAQALGITATPDQPLEDALDALLRPKRLLLLLDNLEHLPMAFQPVADLLSACPRLTVLATSRAALHLRGEQEYPVAPLAVPAGDAASTEAVLAAPAVALFAARAAQVTPAFALTDENGPAVADICRQLDGLPLAIELAAARVKALPPKLLLARLERRLTLLTGGARDLPARQQTLRDTIAWSYDLLSEAEQALFRRLALFAGGCTLDAAEAIGDASGDVGLAMLDGIASLVDKNLLRRVEQADGEPRFTMLETIRDYGREQAEATAEAAALRRRHAAYYLALAERLGSQRRGPGREAWLTGVEREHDNLRAALAWSIAQHERETALRLAVAVAPFWRWRGHWVEGYRWLEEALASEGAATPAARAAAVSRLAVVAEDLGRDEQAERLSAEGLALCRSLGDAPGAAGCLQNLASLAMTRGDHGRARSLYEESLALFREAGDDFGTAELLHELGDLASDDGELAGAASLYEESLALRRRIGDRLGVAFSLGALGSALGTTTPLQGELDRAVALQEESLALLRELGYTSGIASRLLSFGVLLAVRGDYERAAAMLRESLKVHRELGGQPGGNMASCLEALGGVAGARGQPERGARLLGAAEALRDAADAPLPRAFRRLHTRVTRSLRAALGEDAFAAAYAEGRTLSLDAAVALALGQTEAPIALP